MKCGSLSSRVLSFASPNINTSARNGKSLCETEERPVLERRLLGYDSRLGRGRENPSISPVMAPWPFHGDLKSVPALSGRIPRELLLVETLPLRPLPSSNFLSKFTSKGG